MTSSGSNERFGMLLKLASVFSFAAMAACVKHLGTSVPVGQTVFARGLLGVAAATIMAWSTLRLDRLKTRNFRSHVLRSTAATASLFTWFIALTLIPLADAQAVLLTGPLLLTVLAVCVLGEPIDRYRMTALAVGVIGVLIMIGPQLSLGTSNPAGMLIALGSALASAVSLLLIRGMTVTEHATTMLFYHSLTMMLCGSITSVAGWPAPSSHQLLVILLAGILGTAAQLLLILAHKYAEAATIAPLEYFSMLAAIFWGYMVFGDLPRPSIWIGALLVIAVGLVIFWREHRLSLATRAAPTQRRW